VTVEDDQGIADGIDAALARGRRRVMAADQAVLQRQLANHEPKCANCRHWDRDPKVPTLGACGFIVYRLEGHGVKELAQILAATLDLSVCSKWEAK
jgi:hypothetical protein